MPQKPWPPERTLAALEVDLDVVPVIERLADQRGRFGVGGREVAERLVAEHDAPAEGVEGPVALDHRDLQRRPSGSSSAGRSRGRRARRRCTARAEGLLRSYSWINSLGLNESVVNCRRGHSRGSVDEVPGCWQKSVHAKPVAEDRVPACLACRFPSRCSCPTGGGRQAGLARHARRSPSWPALAKLARAPDRRHRRGLCRRPGPDRRHDARPDRCRGQPPARQPGRDRHRLVEPHAAARQVARRALAGQGRGADPVPLRRVGRLLRAVARPAPRLLLRLLPRRRR